MSPVLQTTPGETKWAGPDLGQNTEEVLKESLGLSKEEIESLKEQGIINQ